MTYLMDTNSDSSSNNAGVASMQLSADSNVNSGSVIPVRLLSIDNLAFCHKILIDRLSRLETEHKTAREALAQTASQAGDLTLLDAIIEQAATKVRVLKEIEQNQQQSILLQEQLKKDIEAEGAKLAQAGATELRRITNLERIDDITIMLAQRSNILQYNFARITQEQAEMNNTLNLMQNVTLYAEVELAQLNKFKQELAGKERAISDLAKKIKLLQRNLEFFKRSGSSSTLFNISLRKISTASQFQSNASTMSLIPGESLYIFQGVLAETLNDLQKMQMQVEDDLMQWKGKQNFNLANLPATMTSTVEAANKCKSEIESLQKRLESNQEKLREIDAMYNQVAVICAESCNDADPYQMDQISAEATQIRAQLAKEKETVVNECDKMRIALSSQRKSLEAINKKIQELLEVQKILKEKEDGRMMAIKKIKLLEPVLKVFQGVVPTETYGVMLVPTTLNRLSNANSHSGSQSMSLSAGPGFGQPLTLGDLQRHGQEKERERKVDMSKLT